MTASAPASPGPAGDAQPTVETLLPHPAFFEGGRPVRARNRGWLVRRGRHAGSRHGGWSDDTTASGGHPRSDLRGCARVPFHAARPHDRWHADPSARAPDVSTEYRPEPIQTAGVTLGDDLLALAELLAKNAHDRWSSQRFSEGWRYGALRDDQRKEHPCLVPYEALPESEKAYDRTIVLE